MRVQNLLGPLTDHLGAAAKVGVKKGALVGAGVGAAGGAALAIFGDLGVLDAIAVAAIAVPAATFWGLIVGALMGLIFGAESTSPLVRRGAIWGMITGVLLGLPGGFVLAIIGLNTPVTSFSMSGLIITVGSGLLLGLCLAGLGVSIGVVVGVFGAIAEHRTQR